MDQLEVFHFESSENFEIHARSNGFQHWIASDLMNFLDYQGWVAFKKAINKAMAACAQLDIPIDDNFTKTTTIIDGKQVEDYKLSRFACYFTTMFCDRNKQQVQKAFAYFAAIADQIDKYIESPENCERLSIRDDITSHEKTLSGVAFDAGVDKYQLFQNAGYRGMYNMNLGQLKSYKRLADPKRSLLDFMGREELAANLFRITQTEAKMKNENVKGQRQSEIVAESVGKEVRDAMKRISNTTPEDLPLSEDLRATKKALKGTHKDFKKIDGEKNNSATEELTEETPPPAMQ